MSSRPESEKRVKYRRFMARPADDRILAIILLVVGSFFGIGAVFLILHTSKNSRSASSRPLQEVVQQKESGDEYVINEQRLIEVTSSLVSADQSVVLFSHGTCVIVKEPTADPVSTAKGMILIASSQEKLPVMTPVEGGHLLATHHAPVHHYFFSEELGFMDSEKADQKQEKASALARDLLKMDAEKAKPLKVLKAREPSS